MSYLEEKKLLSQKGWIDELRRFTIFISIVPPFLFIQIKYEMHKYLTKTNITLKNPPL
jgi:hypothetical protein